MDQKGVNNSSLDEEPKNFGIITSYQFLMERSGGDDIYFSKERTEDQKKENNNNELPDLKLPVLENLKHDEKDSLPSDKSNNKGSYPNIYIGPQGLVMKMM
jgi:hypothetical protein